MKARIQITDPAYGRERAEKLGRELAKLVEAWGGS
jgi:hypothetical protein